MSVEAVGWAFRQRIPPKPKVVLLALADQTDEATGRVCYGKTDMKHLARKASCGERSLYRYIAALVRNGYVLKQSGKEKGAASEYWLCLDRLPAASMKDWQWKADEDGADASEADEDVADEGSAILADPQNDDSDAKMPAGDVQNGRGGLPQDGRHRVSLTSDINESSASARETSFSREAQDAQIEHRQIQKAAEKAGAKQFVFENSEAWHAWGRYRRSIGQSGTLPSCTAVIDGKSKRGWWMPSLYPPRAPIEGPSNEGARRDSG